VGAPFSFSDRVHSIKINRTLEITLTGKLTEESKEQVNEEKHSPFPHETLRSGQD